MNELEEIENGPCYQSGDNDPVNGRFVNARHKKLCVESDWRGVRGEKDEERERQIHREEVEIFKEEAAKNNPLDIMGTILFKPYQDLGGGLFFDN